MTRAVERAFGVRTVGVRVTVVSFCSTLINIFNKQNYKETLKSFSKTVLYNPRNIGSWICNVHRLVRNLANLEGYSVPAHTNHHT